MNIVIKNVNELPYIETYDKDELGLEDMQSLVGGYIECVSVTDKIDMWVNEEGKLYLPLNFFIDNGSWTLDVICGNVFFASHDDEGNVIGLTAEEEYKVIDMLMKRYTFGYCEVKDGCIVYPTMEIGGDAVD